MGGSIKDKLYIFFFGLVSNMYQKNAILQLGIFVCFFDCNTKLHFDGKNPT